LSLLFDHLKVQIAELGNLHAEIDKALDGAAGSWKRFPTERGDNGPIHPALAATRRYSRSTPPADGSDRGARGHQTEGTSRAAASRLASAQSHRRPADRLAPAMHGVVRGALMRCVSKEK
jgi:hypothetical protein